MAISEKEKKISCKFLQFLVIKTLDPDWIWIGIQPKMLGPDPDSMKPDPRYWMAVSWYSSVWGWRSSGQGPS
jgi:hypothetical protein